MGAGGTGKQPAPGQRQEKKLPMHLGQIFLPGNRRWKGAGGTGMEETSWKKKKSHRQ